MEKEKVKREGFSSGLAVFFATLGSAVGLGNIWKFPYLTGANGGGAFLLVYLICIIAVGLPVMISEFYIGRKTKKNVMGAIGTLKPKTRFWKVIAWFGILAAYLIMFFYTCVAGWVYSYVFKAITGTFAGIDAKGAESIFGKAVSASATPIIWQFVAIIVVSIILICGVKKGIERITKTLMPVLFVLIIICDIRSLTLPNAMQGVSFLFHVNFHELTAAGVLMALGLAFFKLSLGMGTMVTYGSYFTDDNNMIATSAKVALSDTIVSVLAGLAIFPAVFSFGMKPNQGPGLLFQTIPLVFSKLPGGNILLVAFFFLASIAATTAMISMVEVVVAFFSEELKLTRTRAVIINAVIIAAIGIFATLSVDSTSAVGKITFLGKGFFDLFDYISSNYLLPLGGLLIALLVGHFLNKKDIKQELSNNGTIKNEKIIDIFFIIVGYVTPTLLILVFLNSIGIIDYILKFLRLK